MRFYFLYIVFIGVLNASAQLIPLDAQFSRITDNDGLSNLTVNSIIQDDDGYIWMGTDDGLSRYDGYNFKVYRNDWDDKTSLPDNLVYSLYTASDGSIWVGKICS